MVGDGEAHVINVVVRFIRAIQPQRTNAKEHATGILAANEDELGCIVRLCFFVANMKNKCAIESRVVVA